MTEHDYDARDFQSSSFFKKEELRRDGAKTLTVQAIEQGEGFAKNGKPPKPVLHLVFPDDRRQSLGTQANLNRMIEWFGPLTSGWIGKTITLYYSPDVRGPNGEEGGIRLRLPPRLGRRHPRRRRATPTR